jgi:hypothetical protein
VAPLPSSKGSRIITLTLYYNIALLNHTVNTKSGQIENGFLIFRDNLQLDKFIAGLINDAAQSFTVILNGKTALGLNA